MKRKLRDTRSKIATPSAIVAVCAAILLRYKNQRMNMLQHMVSLILHRGHAGKQVQMSITLCVEHTNTSDFYAGVSSITEDDVVPLSLPYQ